MSSTPPPASPSTAKPGSARRWLRDLGVRFAQRFGSALHDAQTGAPLGRALLIPWGGKIHVIGLEAEFSVRPQFLVQPRLTYWKQEIGFVASPAPDYPHEPAADQRPRP